jgi:hypothetical protein
MTPLTTRTTTATAPVAQVPGSTPAAIEPPAPWIVPSAAASGGVEWLPRTRPHRGI